MFHRLALRSFSAADLRLGQALTYEGYTALLDGIAFRRTARRTLQSGLFQDLKDNGLTGPLMRLFGNLKAYFTKLVAETGVGFAEIIAAFKQGDVFKVLKIVAFDLRKLLAALEAATRLVGKGLAYVLEDIAKSSIMQEVRKGTAKVDALFNKYPILKHLIGPALAGLLLWMWLSSTVVGGARADFDLTNVGAAFAGHFSVTDLFTSTDGLAMLTLFAVGFTGVSLPWIASDMVNLIIALTYTGLRYLHKHDALGKLADFMHFQHVK